jgi:hypothetical protein
MRNLPASSKLFKRSNTLWAYSCLLLLLTLAPAPAPAAGLSDRKVEGIMEIVDTLKDQLGVLQPLEVKIVPNNSRGFSVEPADRSGHFLLNVDAAFLTQLDDEELTAAVAHELGHVWIYTHHPFLHTEALANRIAMRVVSRDSLKKLYMKLWRFEGSHGSYQEVLATADVR